MSEWYKESKVLLAEANANIEAGRPMAVQENLLKVISILLDRLQVLETRIEQDL